MSKKLTDHLNIHLSDLHLFYTKLHNYHWNIEGSSFFQLHATLEGLYDKVAEELDEVAERILQLGDRPLARLSDYLKHSKLEEAESKGVQAEEIIPVLLKDYEYFIESLKAGIALAEENDDIITGDLLTGSLAEYEKTLWMLKASLA